MTPAATRARPLLVSIVIPTRNAGPAFAETLAAIAAQAGGFERELIVVDSGSTDETVALAAAHGAEIVPIPSAAFNHGATRNEGIRRARGEYVALLVQDAVPADERWLAALVEALQDDPRAAGAYSRHLARPDSDYLARYVAEYWHRRLGGRRVQEMADPAAYRALPPAAQRERCTFNNVSSIVRRSVWREHPFPAVPYGEDLAWGKRVLEAGYRLIYEPASRVVHSHRRPPEYELRRAFVDARALATLFPLPPQSLSLVEAGELLRLFQSEQELAQADLARPAAVAGLPAMVDAYCEGEEWYRAHFDAAALRQLFGRSSPWPPGDRRYLLDSLDRLDLTRSRPLRALVRLSRRLRAGAAPGGPPVAPPPAPAPAVKGWPWWQTLARAAARRPPLSRRILEAALAGGPIGDDDLAFVFTHLWNGLGRDYARRAVLDALDGRPARPLDAVQQEQRSFALDILQGARAEGCLTRELFWAVRLYAAARVIGRYLGMASVAAPGEAELGFWQDLERRWAPGI